MIMKIAKQSRRSHIALFVFFSLFFVREPAQARENLRIGYWHIPPHVTEVVDGKPKGTAIGYFEKYIAPELDVTVVWDEKITPPTRLMNQLRQGEKDAMIFLGKTKERTEYLHYPDPYLDIPQTFAFLKSHPINRVSEISELYGLRVGFLVGGRIPDELRDDRIRFDLIAGERLLQRNIEKLLLGRIDAIYSPLTIALNNTITQMDAGDRIKLVPIEFVEPVLIYTVFSKKTVEKAVVEKYNEALEAANKKQQYKDYVKTQQSDSTVQ